MYVLVLCQDMWLMHVLVLCQDMSEHITGTAALVNIKLDGHQNKLIAINVMASGISAINCECH